MEILEKSWYKRRRPEKQSKPIDVKLENFIKEHNSFCKMIVTYEDGSTNAYIARVLHNEINGNWYVDGMHVAVKL